MIQFNEQLLVYSVIGHYLEFEGLVAGLDHDERLVEELLTGSVLLKAGLLAGMACGLCGCSSNEVKLVKTVGKSCSHRS